MTGVADAQSAQLSGSADRIYTYKLVATVATAYKPRSILRVRKLALSLDSKAAAAAFTEGAAKSDVASASF